MPAVADPAAFFWSVLLLQVVGVASMLLARRPQPTLLHHFCRRLFIASLIVVGLATVYSMGTHSDHWAWCGTVFSIMAVGGTMDLGGAR